MDVTSGFKGITTPIADLYAQIHSRGWTVTKVDTKDGAYVASVKNPHGESVEKTGRDPQTALAAALTYIVRKEFIRQGAWTQHWGDQLEPIAKAYAKAPTFDPAAAGAWAELAADNMGRAQALQQQLQVEIVDEPDPYSSPQELWKDVERNKKIKVTRANSAHPLWNEDQVLAHRLVHDVLGHAAAGGDFGWTGENLATAAHMPYLSPSAQAALFSETVGQAAYRNYYRGHGPRKIVFLNEFLNPAQQQNNPPGHGGEPIEHSLTPGPLPEGRTAVFEPDFGSNHVLNWEPGQEGKGILTGDGAVHTWKTFNQSPHHADYRGAQGLAPFGQGGAEFRIQPDGRTEIYGERPGHSEAIRGADPRLRPESYGQGFEGLWARTAGLRMDPNAGYTTGIVPPAVNAVNSFGDPLDHMGIKDVAHKLDTGWANFKDAEGKPDYSRMKQAVINAFRAALMSPRKELRWNAVHYQDMMHIPHDVSDPKVYWEALENARVDHNRRAGVPHPEVAHKAHYEALLDFYRYYQKLHPDMDPGEVKEHADREVMVMQQEIEEKMIAEGKDAEQDIMEPKVFKALDKRLKQIMKDDPSKLLYSSAMEDQTMAPTTDKYGAFIGRHLTSIAKVSRHSDMLLEAALEDVKNHDGQGHHFRQAVLSLNVPYVGPKVTSFVWLLLQPLTSQLATIDTHMTDLLGYKQADVANNRDYFRLERELQAGRDAAGYSHMPLGQFQWSMWDNKRNGEGEHQDHSALRPWNPQDHSTIDWKPQVNLKNIKGEEYEPPKWWALTEPYRQNEVAKWNIDVAPFYPKNQIPWQNKTVNIPVIASASGEGNDDELHISLDVPERIRERIALWMAELDLTDVEPLDPAEYHITLAYAEHGVDDAVVQSATRRFNFTGLKFEGKSLTRFNSALVIELTCDGFDKWATDLNDWLEDQGVDVSRYPGGYKPHITIGYTERDDIRGSLPPLSFRAGRMGFSTPRPLRETGRPLTASAKLVSLEERREINYKPTKQIVSVDTPPEIVPSQRDEPLIDRGDWTAKRIPFIYTPQTNQVYMGPKGTHHGAIEREHVSEWAKDMDSFMPRHEGMLFTEPWASAEVGDGLKKNFHWWNAPANRQSIEQAVAAAHPQHVWDSNFATQEQPDNLSDESLWKDSSQRCPKCSGALTVKGDCRECGYVPEPPAIPEATSRGNGDKNHTSADIEDPNQEQHEYRGFHRAPGNDGYSAPMHALNKLVPDDIYTHPQFYIGREPHDRESWQVARRVKDRPDALVRVYRATPGDTIHPGDWVTPSEAYARKHGMHPTDPAQDMPVIHQDIPAGHLFWEGNDINEYGYAPPLSHVSALPRGYQPFDQQARGVNRLDGISERCHFHPLEPAVAHAGFYNMCSECLHSYQQAQLSTVPDIRTVEPQRLASDEPVWSEPEDEMVKPDPLLAELQAKVDNLTETLATVQKPPPTPEKAARRKLMIRRDDNGRIASIEEDTE